MSEAAVAPATPPASTSISGAGSNRPAPTAPPPVEAAPKAPEVKESPAPAKTYRLKVNGGEREVSEQTYHAYAQKAAAADQMLSEAKAERQRVETERAALKERWGKDWRSAVQEAGHDPDEFLKQAILAKYGQAELTPEQKRAQEAQQRAEAAEQKLKGYESEREQAQAQADQRAAEGEYQRTFLAALEKAGFEANPESPVTEWAIKRMAAMEEANLDAGTRLPPEVLGEMVRADLEAQHVQVLGALDGDALLDRLGPDVTKKVSKALVARYERTRAGAQQLGSTATAPTDPRPIQRPGLATPVNLPPKDPNSGRFVSREERRGSSMFSGFIPASVTQGG